jgi:cysteine desulfurase
MREIYADHASTTAPAPEVVRAMEPFFGGRFGNPSSVHRRGEAAREALTEARRRVADLIGAIPEEIVFTASGSEANNLALRGMLASAGEGRRRLVVSAIEHPSVLETARALEPQGFRLTIVPASGDGIVDLAALGAAIGPDVALVSLMLANNETGMIQPVAEAARLAHAAGARIHTDAVQAVGKVPVDVATLDVDLLSLAGHKFHGPLGAAALWMRRRTRAAPQITGGHQERSRRAGTEALPLLVGLGCAAARAQARIDSDGSRVRALASALADGLRTRISGTVLHGADQPRVPGIVNVRFEGVDGEAVLHELDRQGITVSTGSACSAASPGPSHVLVGMGLSPEQAHASVRFSLGEENGPEDVEQILSVVPGIVERLRALGGREPVARVANG